MPESQESVRIDYPKHWFVIGTILWAVGTSLLLYLGVTAKELATRSFWLGAGIAVGVLVFLFFVPPLFTHHEAGKKALRIKMGVLIDAAIPYTWIREVKETSITWGGVRVGIGVRYNGVSRMLFVTTEFSDLLVLKLDGPHQMGRVLKRQVEQIVVSTSFRSKAASVLNEKIGHRTEA